ncbi:MAG TPA: NADH-quinone oxidoreductase subunit NuoH, partial [Deinococcales bacterium]|nr:NADH-quinone oxidoreductase subunit NuoH [Deinococcales bacterium]
MSFIEFLVILLKAVALALVLLGGFAYMTLIERRMLGRFQIRRGPNRVGWNGLLQPIADAIKTVFKEDVKVTMADAVIYYLAPLISITFALLAFGAIPAGPPNSFFGANPWVFSLDIGLLFILASTSMGVYGIFLGGWSSGSKYPLMGGLRSSAQIISYELGQGLSILGLVILVGSFNLRDFNAWQASNGWLILFQGVAFVTYFISALAETNRSPFDLPEAEQELVAGYLTEFSSIKWALYQMAEYVNAFTACALIATIFLGGWHGPAFLDAIIPGISQWVFVWLILKMAVLIFVLIWVRATMPRIRYDKLMQFGWKVLFPTALVN